MKCSTHPTRTADFECYQCTDGWCLECADQEDFGSGPVSVCPDCRSELHPVDDGSATSIAGIEHEHTPSFWAALPGAFVYPFRDGGWMMLLYGGVFSLLVGVGSFLPLFGLIPVLWFGGYLVNYFMTVVNASANGEDDLPHWPPWTDVWASSIGPLLRVTVLWAVAFGPFLAAIYYLDASENAVWATLGWAALYLPMGYLGISLDQSIVGVHPLRAVVSMVKIPLHYLAACIVLAAAATASTLLEQTLAESGFAGIAASSIVSVYFLAVESRILGYMYFANRRRLAWYGED